MIPDHNTWQSGRTNGFNDLDEPLRVSSVDGDAGHHARGIAVQAHM